MTPLLYFFIGDTSTGRRNTRTRLLETVHIARESIYLTFFCASMRVFKQEHLEGRTVATFPLGIYEAFLSRDFAFLPSSPPLPACHLSLPPDALRQTNYWSSGPDIYISLYPYLPIS